MKYITAVCALLLLGATSCAGMVAESAQSATAGYIGCPAREVIVTDVQMHLGATSWTASCRGVRLICSRTSSGANQAEITQCAPELPPTAP